MTKKKTKVSAYTPPAPPDMGKSEAHPSWQFRCMIDQRDRCVIKPWLADLSLKGQASLDRAIEHLAQQPQQSWTRPHASKIGDNIYVIHCHDENRTQHRPFGHFHPADHSAVLTLTGYEKDNTYYPKNYVRTTADRCTQCNADHTRCTTRCRYADAVIGSTLKELGNYHLECQSCSKCDDIHSDRD
jgi:hypothetical protein